MFYRGKNVAQDIFLNNTIIPDWFQVLKEVLKKLQEDAPCKHIHVKPNPTWTVLLAQ